MVQTGDYLSPTYFGEDRFQKPILFYWFIILGYKLFGVGWFGARFFSVIFAGLTVVTTWLLAKEIYNRRVATLSALILMILPMFFRHAKNVVPDMAMNFFIVLAMFFLVRYLKNINRNMSSMACFVACAFGFMIKGFAAFIVPFGTLIIYCFWYQRINLLIRFGFLRGAVIMLLIISPWFIYMFMIHGQGYLDYMLGSETTSRLMGNIKENLLWLKVTTFFRHMGFYLQTMFSWFAPWSLFVPIVLGFHVLRKKNNKYDEELTGLLLIWFFLVYFFFSFMYFKISHYILVLSSSFAILTAGFLLAPFDGVQWWERALKWFRWGTLVFTNVVILVAVGFLVVYLAAGGWPWVIMFMVMIVGVIFINFKFRQPAVAAFTLALCMAFVQSQTGMISKTKLTSHTTFQKLAGQIQKISPELNNYKIGVASHDLHEKELQIYFDQEIFKAGHSWPGVVQINLKKLFAHDKVYCFVLEKDYETYQKFFKGTEIILRDDIIRKRFYLDKGFVKALINFDQPVIHDYLYENILLVRKD